MGCRLKGHDISNSGNSRIGVKVPVSAVAPPARPVDSGRKSPLFHLIVISPVVRQCRLDPGHQFPRRLIAPTNAGEQPLVGFPKVRSHFLEPGGIEPPQRRLCRHISAFCGGALPLQRFVVVLRYAVAAIGAQVQIVGGARIVLRVVLQGAERQGRSWPWRPSQGELIASGTPESGSDRCCPPPAGRTHPQLIRPSSVSGERRYFRSHAQPRDSSQVFSMATQPLPHAFMLSLMEQLAQHCAPIGCNSSPAGSCAGAGLLCGCVRPGISRGDPNRRPA